MERYFVFLRPLGLRLGGWRLNLELFELIKKDVSTEDILKNVENFPKKHGTFFFLTNIDFLVKGGWLSSFKGFIANKIKLIISIFCRYDTLNPLENDKPIVTLFKKSINTEFKFTNKTVVDSQEVVDKYNTKDHDRFKSFIA